MTDPILEFDGVSKRFGGVRALQGVSFAVPGGEVHALVGENGSGKSTLIRICGGVFPPDEGTIRFEGREVSFADPLASRAAGISVVHQEIPICPDLTAAQNVLLGQWLEIQSIRRVIVRADRLRIAVDHDRFNAFFS